MLSLERQEPAPSSAAVNATGSTGSAATTTSAPADDTATSPASSTTAAAASTAEVVEEGDGDGDGDVDEVENEQIVSMSTTAAPSVEPATGAGANNVLRRTNSTTAPSIVSTTGAARESGSVSTTAAAAPPVEGTTTEAAVTTRPANTTTSHSVSGTTAAAFSFNVTPSASTTNSAQVASTTSGASGNTSTTAAPSVAKNVIRRMNTTTAPPTASTTLAAGQNGSASTTAAAAPSVGQNGTTTGPAKPPLVTVPGCVTRKDARSRAWFAETAAVGSQCIFGVDTRDEGSHCVSDEAFGSHGWCYTSADGSTWGSCGEGCPLFGPTKALSEKVDEVEKLLRGLAAGLNVTLPEATKQSEPQAISSVTPVPGVSASASLGTSQPDDDSGALALPKWEVQQRLHAGRVVEDLAPVFVAVTDDTDPAAAAAGPEEVGASSLEGAAGASPCMTLARPGSWVSTEGGTPCIFGLDPRDEGTHCIMDAGTNGWCWTAKDRSAWAFCAYGCPLAGPARELGEKIDALGTLVEAFDEKFHVSPPVPQIIAGMMLMQVDSERGSTVLSDDDDECPALDLQL